jgi:hypothetical protein
LLDLEVSEVIEHKGDAASTDFSHSPSESLVKWQTVFALLLTSGTVKMSVKQYNSVCEIMKWQASKSGSDLELLPSYSTLQRRMKPMMYQCLYARSKIRRLPTRDGGYGNVRVVPPSEWATLDARTGVLCDAMFGCHTSLNNIRSTGFVFHDIENVPVLENRRRTLDTSQFIFVDAAQQSKELESADFRRLPVAAERGDTVSVSFQSCEAANRSLGIHASISSECDEISSVTCMISAIWQVGGDSLLFSESELSVNAPSFQICSSLKPGDIAVELVMLRLDRQRRERGFELVLVYRFIRSASSGVPISTRQLFLMSPGSMNNGELNMATCISCNVRSLKEDLLPNRPGSTALRAPCIVFFKRWTEVRGLQSTAVCDDFQPHVSKPVSYNYSIYGGAICCRCASRLTRGRGMELSVASVSHRRVYQATKF